MKHRRATALFAVGAAVVGLSILASELVGEARANEKRAGPPTRINPSSSRRGEPVSLEKGGHLLLGLLQQFADGTGELVYVVGDVPADANVNVREALETLDPTEITAVLAENGFTMSREEFRDEEVYWVRKRLDRSKKKRGAIVRRGDRSPTAPRAAKRGSKVGTVSERLSPTGNSDVRVFQRVDGDETRFLITFETTSRKEAEEVARTIGLILSDQKRSRRSDQ